MQEMSVRTVRGDAVSGQSEALAVWLEEREQLWEKMQQGDRHDLMGNGTRGSKYQITLRFWFSCWQDRAAEVILMCTDFKVALQQPHQELLCPFRQQTWKPRLRAVPLTSSAHSGSGTQGFQQRKEPRFRLEPDSWVWLGEANLEPLHTVEG